MHWGAPTSARERVHDLQDPGPENDDEQGRKEAEQHREQDLDRYLLRQLLSALEKCRGNKAEVARMLGVQRTTLYYRLKRLGIDV